MLWNLSIRTVYRVTLPVAALSTVPIGVTNTRVVYHLRYAKAEREGTVYFSR